MLALLVFAMSANPSIFSSSEPQYEHLGGEYFNIAQALVDGRGFSDPFGGQTGPTAWMPPLFPCLLALMLALLQDKSLVASAVVLLTNVALVVTGVCLFRVAAQFRPRVSLWLCVAIYVGWLVAFYDWLLLLTHDIWLLALLTAFMLLALVGQSHERRVNAWSWGTLGGAAALASPALAFAWGGVTLHRLWRWPEQRKSAVRCLLLASLIAAPWLARNAYHFGAGAGLKSNLFFEAYQATFIDDDGIPDLRSIAQHPYNSPVARHDYAELGETAFLNQYRRKFLRELALEPDRYLYGTANRALAATVRHVPLLPTEFAPPVRLEQLVYPLPVLAGLLALLVRWHDKRALTPVALLYVLYLAPYVLISFYLRYALALTPVLILFLFLGADAVAWLVAGTLPAEQRTMPDET